MSAKWLSIAEGVQLTAPIEAVINKLEGYFEIQNLRAVVTSGLRTREDQLRIIVEAAQKRGMSPTFGQLDYDKKFDNGRYVWQEVWSELLRQGFIVNPPHPAECLFDYIRGNENRKGRVIGMSPHYFGRAFDIGGTAAENVIKYALTHNPDIGIRGFLVERANNAVHVDVA